MLGMSTSYDLHCVCGTIVSVLYIYTPFDFIGEVADDSRPLFGELINIHKLLLRQGDASYIVRRFEEECRGLLSQVCHPNIVQFLGVYFQQRV